MVNRVALDGTFEADVTGSGVLDKAESLVGRFEVDIDCKGVASGSDTLIGDRCKKLDFRVNCSLVWLAV